MIQKDESTPRRVIHTAALMECERFLFKTNFGVYLVGPSGSGKSEFIFKLMENSKQICDKPITSIIYCYNIYSERFNDYKKYAHFYEGVPSKDEILDMKRENTLLILDDLAGHIDSKKLTEMFTVWVHHLKINIIFVAHNFFLMNRTARSSANYFILTCNRADRLQIRNLASQLFPGNTKYLIDTYEDVCKEPYSYLIIDNHQLTDYRKRLVTKIFPGEDTIYYFPKLN